MFKNGAPNMLMIEEQKYCVSKIKECHQRSVRSYLNDAGVSASSKTIRRRLADVKSWSRTKTTPIDCPWIVVINQLGSDQCTWPWGHCLLSELSEWRRQTGRHNGLRCPFDNRQSVSQNNHVIFSRVL
ncbi:hypothetical protein TNCV_909871 [Trichonephila clavipes]|nr:hypothetical protein TNCV_909871 [Trichonephila clavipes]